MGNTGGKINTHLLIPRRILSVLVWDSLPPRLGLRFLAASPFFSFFCSSEHCVRFIFIFIFHYFVSPSSSSGYFCCLSFALILPLPPLPVSLPTFLQHSYSLPLIFSLSPFPILICLSYLLPLIFSFSHSLFVLPLFLTSKTHLCFIPKSRICTVFPNSQNDFHLFCVALLPFSFSLVFSVLKISP